MSDVESQLRAADPLRAIAVTPIDFDAMKSRITASGSSAPTSRGRHMKVLAMASAAVLVITVSLVSLSLGAGDSVHHGPRFGPIAKAGARSVIYGSSAATASLGFGTTTNAGTYAPESTTTIYAAGTGLNAPANSGSVYKLNAFTDSTSEAQRLATIFGVGAIMAPVPTSTFAAEYQAGDMSSSTGSMQYFLATPNEPGAGFGTFQYIADGEENWSFNGPITSTVDPTTAARDLHTVDALWKALDTGFTLSDPTWMVMQLSSDSNAATTTETQVNFFLSIDGHQTFQVEEFSFDDTGKLVYAVGPTLTITNSVTFPFATMAATISRLNAHQYGDCSPSAAPLSSTWTSTTNPSATTAPVTTETLDGVSILYQPEMMSNGEPWLVPFYQFTTSSGNDSSAPYISALGPEYFSVQKGSGTSCSETLTQP